MNWIEMIIAIFIGLPLLRFIALLIVYLLESRKEGVAKKVNDLQQQVKELTEECHSWKHTARTFYDRLQEVENENARLRGYLEALKHH